MKVFFVPNYFYLNFPVFRELISRLSKRQEIDCFGCLRFLAMTRRTILYYPIDEVLSFLYAQDEVVTSSSISHNDKIIYQTYVSSKKNMRKVWRIAQVRILINKRILPKKFIKDNIPFIEFRLVRFCLSRIKINQSFLHLLQFLLNR